MRRFLAVPCPSFVLPLRKISLHEPHCFPRTSRSPLFTKQTKFMMSGSPKKTYLLAPNFDFTPDGAIALGNIIADPFEPHRPLTTLDTNKPHPEITPAKSDFDYTINRSSSQDVSVGVWAQFLNIIGGNIGARQGQETNTEYSMQSLETIMFKTEPTNAMINERLEDPIIRNVMQYNSTFCRPIYMITGIKIAKGLVAMTEKLTTRGGNFGITVPLAEGDSVGANVDMSRGKGQKDAFRVGVDVVFAYRLLKIGLKGWKEKTITSEEFKPRQAFLSDSSDEEEEELLEADVSAATSADISNTVKGDVTVTEIEFSDGEDNHVAVISKKI